jgi:hypothetical protein
VNRKNKELINFCSLVLQLLIQMQSINRLSINQVAQILTQAYRLQLSSINHQDIKPLRSNQNRSLERKK